MNIQSMNLETVREEAEESKFRKFKEKTITLETSISKRRLRKFWNQWRICQGERMELWRNKGNWKIV